MTSTWLVVPCQRARLPQLGRLLDSLQHPPDLTVVVADGFDAADLAGQHVVPQEPERGMNLARWWNLGMDYAASVAGDAWHEVAVVSSDVVGRPDSLALLRAKIRVDGLTMVGPNLAGDADATWHAGSQRTVATRVPAECWMLPGELGLRADERMRWWYADDDLEMQARRYGALGLVGVVGGTGLRLGDPSSYLSEEQQRWAAESRELFVSKWGCQPW